MDQQPASQLQSPVTHDQQLKAQRRTVDFDTFDIHMQQLISMLKSKQIWIAPAYQRKFRWGDDRSSQFIESIMLGIPVPSLFMATNPDNTWEVVDGVQRLSTLIRFAGGKQLCAEHGLDAGMLVLSDLKKLTLFNGFRMDQLPMIVQQHFWTRPCKVVTLNDKSDLVVRYDLFERLNTGGVALSPQEIRDCIFRGPFADKIDELAKNPDFRKSVRLTPLQQRDATAEECVLRFFAFRDGYKKFEHSVGTFLSAYMEAASKSFDYVSGEDIFLRTFKELARVFPNGIRRPGGKGTTPLNLFEGVAVGASLALDKVPRLDTSSLNRWMASDLLRKYTTGATNNRPAVLGRIEFCRDRFLGKPYVPSSAA